MTTFTNAQLRARVLEFAERVVIKRNGEVHAYGRMPNTNQVGWYLKGYRDELAALYAEEAEAK